MLRASGRIGAVVGALVVAASVALLTPEPAAAACNDVTFSPAEPDLLLGVSGSTYVGHGEVWLNCSTGHGQPLGGAPVKIVINVSQPDVGVVVTMTQTNLTSLTGSPGTDMGPGVTFAGTIPAGTGASFKLSFDISIPTAAITVSTTVVGTDQITVFRPVGGEKVIGSTGGEISGGGSSGGLPSATPELDSLALFAVGALGLAGVVWQQGRKRGAL
jgi:hypothetical protein